MYTALRLVLFLASVGLAWAPAWAVADAQRGPLTGGATIAAPAPSPSDAPAVNDHSGATAPFSAIALAGLPAVHALPDEGIADRMCARGRLAVPTPRHRARTHDARGPPLA